jgi:hypothetical protein
MIPSQRVYWRADRCLATSYKHSSYCCVFTISLPSNGITLPIVAQEFVFAGRCLPNCSLATDMHVTLFNFVKILDFLTVEIERHAVFGLIQYFTKRKEKYLLLQLFNVNKSAKMDLFLH